jgi:hypothetical protein
MKTPYLRKNLCEKLCRYFKPAKEEYTACGGYLVVEELLRRGRKKLSFEKIVDETDDIIERALITNMCRTCPFYEDGCDFVQQKEKSSPCGGFMLLGSLLQTKTVSIDDIRDIV